MSRVGLRPIEVPSGVTVTFDGATAKVKGPKGEIVRELPDMCKYEQEGSTIRVTRSSDEKKARSLHGLSRTLLANMVEGVANGFSKELEIIGIGYKAEVKGKELVLTLGFSHLVHFKLPEGITVETPAPTKLKINGIRKDQVGQVAADIRQLRPPEPYKGKGIKYVGEFIQRKAGKTAAST
ncbi:MAG: 50S ribosomal protein L6 [bacterium]|nr:50S ribosomal protein L6 [bacterium]